MKRLLFISLILYLSNTCLLPQVKITSEKSEANKYTLNFIVQPPKYSVTTKKGVKIINFEHYLDESKSGEFVSPTRELFIPIPPKSHPTVTLSVNNKLAVEGQPSVNPEIEIYKDSVVNYKSLEAPTKFKKNSLYVVKGFLWVGNHYCLHLKINLTDFNVAKNITYVNNSFSLTLLFKKTYQPQLSKAVTNSSLDKVLLNNYFYKNFTSSPSYRLENTDSWIDYSKKYVKIGVAKDGIFRIEPADLSSLGVNVSQINPMTFKLINKGNEIPIYVSGENDGSFDQSDYIEFVGIRNMGGHHREVAAFGQSYNEYLGRYTDTTIYWLTWDGSNGKRVDVSNGDQGLVTADTLKYYSEIEHNEVNNWFDFSMEDQVRRELPYWFENKSWFEKQIGVGVTTRNFTASDIYPNADVKLFAKIQDYASSIITNAHLMSLSINSNPSTYDSGYVNKYETKVLSAVVNSNLLTNGTNKLKINYYPTASDPNTCQIDWDEEEYPRYLNAINDSLDFRFDYLSSVAIAMFSVTNIDSPNVICWKYGDSFKKYVVDPQNGKVTIKDTISGNDKFILINDKKISSPKFYYLKQFQNLKDSKNSAQYLAITNKKFWNECLSYVQFISDSYGISAKAIDVDDIYDQFAYGYFNPESIRDFLESTQMYWQDPKPKYIFLIGSANYDYYGNKVKNFGAPPKYNNVPSFGAPVSDTWFVIFDTTGSYIPQMDIGRLPVQTNAEFQHYFDKHKNYLNEQGDEWNKKYIFFSGGNFTDPSQIAQLKETNDYIINNYVKPPPIGGEVEHFYKTTDPITNFGPVSADEVQSAIESGAVVISYLGHSGTETWDNSITDIEQLNNKYNKNPLITDFGCSTGKFAEPDVVSFSEEAVDGSGGQAIAYIGNSSLGFTSTSYVFPQIFYGTVFQDSVYNLGDAHRLAKIKMMNTYSSGGTYELFTLTNTLIGDPIINLQIPSSPQLHIAASDISVSPADLNDNTQNAEIKIKYHNFGKVTQDSLEIKVSIVAPDTQYVINEFENMPLFLDSVAVSIPVKNKPGLYSVNVQLDPQNKISEIFENDNSTSSSFNVASSLIRLLNIQNESYQTDGNLIFLNPVIKPENNNFSIETSTSKNFTNSIIQNVTFDTFSTKFKLGQTLNDSRVWLRTKVLGGNSYGNTETFFVGKKDGYLLNDSISFANAILSGLKISKNHVIVDSGKISLQVISAGFSDGKTAVISEDGQNFIPENTKRGNHICLFDANTLEFEGYRLFDGDDTGYLNFLDSLSNKYIVCFAIADNGSSSSQALKNEIKTFGSKYIDSVGFRYSWAMIGRKGASPGSVPEAFSAPFQGRVTIDTVIDLKNFFGRIVTSKIGPASKWNKLIISQNIKQSTVFNLKLIRTSIQQKTDTITGLSLSGKSVDLSFINAKQFPYLNVIGEYSSNSDGISPTIDTIEVDYNNLAELGTNYQVVSIGNDSIPAGGNENLQFYVYNVGEAPADSFNVKVDVVNSDNIHNTIFECNIDSLNPNSRKIFNVNYIASSGSGVKSFYINIDPENKISELYKDNNIYSIPFYVKPDTSQPSLDVKFDGRDIFNGDYVASNPKIQIELNDPSLLPIADTSAVSIFLNNEPVYYNSNQSQLTYKFNSSNPKFEAAYSPELKDGSYSLKVLAKNPSSSLTDTTSYTKTFTVSSEPQLLYVYNYPDPFQNDTYFTFKLTQIPDKLEIRIFTIAGRLIRDIKVNSSSLKTDFNNIYWDGRDQNGDKLANGVYLYKINMSLNGKTSSVIQKLAIVR